MTDPAPKIIETSDGSHSLYLPELKETYHSSHGAVTESVHVFIREGLEYLFKKNKQEINVFEVGFGTGLNSLLAKQWAAKNNCKINYNSIEQFPVDKEVFDKLNYGRILNDERGFEDLHTYSWNEKHEVSNFFSLNKVHASWILYDLPEEEFQVIFYDAFAPGKQPEMWNLDLIEKCYRGLKSGGILVTYCAQGQFKRNMIAAGFNIEVIPGPPGKKEMVRGVK